MAKAFGNSRIVVPDFDSRAERFKAAAGNGRHEELATKLAEDLKLERQDSGELTPGSRVSWASQVEEEHEATGWAGLPRPAKQGMKGVENPEDASKKSKKKKKKKNKMPSSSTTAENSVSSPTAAASAAAGTSETVEEQSEECPAVPFPETSLEFPGISSKGDGSSDGNAAAQSGDNKKGRMKGGNSVWAMKRSDLSGSPKVEDPKAGKLPGSSWQPVGAKDIPPQKESGDSGLGVPAKHTGGGSSGGWGTPPENEDSGWKVAGPRRGRGDPTPAGIPLDGAAPQSSVGGNWDEPIPVEVSSNWDSGWEVAGSRRGKKGEDTSVKAPGGQNVGQKAKGGRGGQQFLPKAMERGPKQRSGELEKPNKGVQEKGGRPSPKNSPGGAGNFGAARQVPVVPSGWGKSLNKSVWDSQPVQSSNNAASAASASAASANSTSILGKLLPAERAWPESNPGIPRVNGGPVSGAPISLDAWKGGFPAFSGNGSSVFDDYPASLYSDSQCSDDDLDSDSMSQASFHSEDSYKSHSTQRMNKWFRNFFQELDLLTGDQLQEHDRQYHCPACQGGVGAIDWYRGLQPLLAHAKTVRSKRVKLHKAFAEVLEEEIRIRGAVPGTHGSGKYGKWRGLGDDNESRDTMIVWPPMVMVRNTQLEQDEDDKWIGMGNKELLDLFKAHNPVKARHAYGPQGHRGISVLVFAESPTGYYNAQRLDKQFSEAHRGKENWDFSGKLLFQPGGDRILYVYMATPEDIEIFNKHSKGKQNIKWERKSLREMVLSPMRRLDEENKKVTFLQGKVQREIEASKTLKKTVSMMSKKLQLREEELQVVRDRARERHQLQETEMEDMEALYKEKIEQLKQEILQQEITLEKDHEEYEHEHMQQYAELEQQASKIPKDKTLSDEQQQQQALMEEEIARESQIVEMCMKSQEDWEAKKAELLKEHHHKMMAFKSKQWEDLLKFEEKLDKERIAVMKTYFQDSTEKQI